MRSVFGFEKEVLTPGMVVKAFRLKLGMTQTQLAEAAKVSPGHISGIESGRSQVSPEMAGKLSAILGLAPDIIRYPNTNLHLRSSVLS